MSLFLVQGRKRIYNLGRRFQGHVNGAKLINDSLLKEQANIVLKSLRSGSKVPNRPK